MPGKRSSIATTSVQLNFSVATQEADSLFVFKLVLFSAGAGAAIKLGSVATHLPELHPTLTLGLAVVAASTLAATSPWCTPAPPHACRPLPEGQRFRAAIGPPAAASDDTERSARLCGRYRTVGEFVERKPGGGFDKAAMMGSIKSFGVAGTLAYIVTELIFWGIALPGGAPSILLGSMAKGGRG